ncbi:MAG: hypothetical protein FJ146_09145 [Deltaproteobacteria bacterium]|nr:hypothetical protein [Deltaproteobacteria bacterium]
MYRFRHRLRFITISVGLAVVAACGSDKDSSHGAPVTPAAPERSPGDQKVLEPSMGLPRGPSDQQPGAGDAQNTGPNQANARGSRLLGIFGGYMSCSGDANSPFKDTWMQTYVTEVQQSLKTTGSPEVKYIMSCFKFDVAKVIFVTSDKPTEVREDSIAQLFSAFEASVYNSPNASVSIAGHSYGGWLSLSLIDQVKTKFPVDALITLDPISRAQCTPPAVLNSILDGQPNASCTRAPADFDATKLAAIKQRAKTWLNIYQTDATILHSGQLTGATNVKRRYTPGDLAAHSQIPGDLEVMKQVISLLAR